VTKFIYYIFFRQLEHDVETVINVLQLGPFEIIEHKFTAQEVKEAESIVKRAVANWERNIFFQSIRLLLCGKYDIMRILI
jgi:hypothetical protein